MSEQIILNALFQNTSGRPLKAGLEGRGGISLTDFI